MTQELQPYEESALAPLATRPPRHLYPSPPELSVMVQIARNAPAAAGFAIPKGIDHPGKAFAVMLAGYELGVGPMVSMRHIAPINGRMEPDAQLMMGICIANDKSVKFRWVTLSREAAVVEISRDGGLVGEFTYSLDDARHAGQYEDEPKRKKIASWNDRRPVYAKNEAGEIIMEPVPVEDRGPWHSHTSLMLAYNAARLGMKLTCSDLINSVLASMGAGEMMLGAVESAEADVWNGEGADLDRPGDFGNAPSRQTPKRNTWEEPPQQGTTQRPNTPSSPPRQKRSVAQWDTDIRAELSRRKLSGVKLAELVGGGNVSHILKYMAANGIADDLDALMDRLAVDETTGEIPDVGEFREEATDANDDSN